MSSRKGYYIFIAVALFAISINFSSYIQQLILFPITESEKAYLDFKNRVSTHFNQAKQIEKLKAENRRLKRLENHLLLYRERFREFKSFKQENLKLTTYLIKPLSYVYIGDFSQLYIDFKEFDNEKIYGVVKDGKSVGIVSENLDRPVAILNSSPLCSYAVFIGKLEAPAVVKGNKDGTMRAEFIPNWLKVKVGDEVITSGLDSIFFKGAKVGKVLSIENSGLYQVAVIKPYIESVSQSYMFATTP